MKPHWKVFVAIAVIVVIGLAIVMMRSRQSGPEQPKPEKVYQVWFTHPGAKPAEDVDQLLCHWLDETKSSLDIAAFELDLPCVEASLIQAKNRGVTVRLVVDSENPSPELKALKKAGVPIVGDNRGAFMHNKFIVRDHNAVWTGSLNFTVSGVERNHNNAIAIADPGMARLYQAEFEEMFLDHAFGPRSPHQELPVVFSLPGLEAEVLFSPEDPVRQRLLDLLKSARKSITFLAFSFTDDEMGKIMLEKAKSGVKVEGVFESMGASTAHSEYGKMKKAGLDVRRDGETKVILHHKVFVIDGETVATGSYNFSANADKSNDENALILHNRELAQAFLDEFKGIQQIAS